MLTGIVCGTITSTIQHPFYQGKKLLMVDKTKSDGTPTGDILIAVDAVDAGMGQEVLVIDEGNSARSIVQSATAPLRSIIVGIIDRVDRG